MRMNKVKRFWPALALAPVLALAVYLSVSLLAGGPPPPALAQGLPADDIPLASAVPGQCGVKANLIGTGQILKDGDCNTRADSLTVVFQNTDPANSLDLAVYVTGGADFPHIDATATTTADTARMLGKRGINEARIRLERQDGFGVPGQRTITVTRSMADDTGAVYLFAYKVLTNAGIPFATDATGFPGMETANNSDDHLADFAIKVQFLDVGVPDAEESSLVAADPDSGETESVVTIRVENMDGDGLTGPMDLTLEGGGDDAYFDVANLKTHRVRIVEGDPTTVVTIKGLPETGPIRAKVTGVFRSLTLSDYITRTVSTPATVTVKAYACAMETDETDDICANESANLANDSVVDDPAELAYVAPGGSFLIAGQARDAAGNRVYGALSWKGADAAANTALAVNSGTTNAATSPATNPDTATVAVAPDAPAGEYRLTVSDSGDNASATARFTVTGKTASLEIGGPDIIPDTGIATYWAKTTDAAGNPASDAASIMPLVVVRTVGEAEILGTENGRVTLSATTGEGSFTLVMPAETAPGVEVVILITAGDLSDIKTVTFGEPQSLGPIDGLSLTSDTDGTVVLEWQAGPGATRHWVAGIKKSDLEIRDFSNIIWTAASGYTTHTVRGLENGEVYIFTVISGDERGWSTWAPLVEVTVNDQPRIPF